MTYEEKEKTLNENIGLVYKIVKPYQNKLSRYGYSIGDLINESLLQVFNSLDHYNGSTCISTYLGKVITNKMNALLIQVNLQRNTAFKTAFRIENIEDTVEMKEKTGNVLPSVNLKGLYHNSHTTLRQAFVEYVMETGSPWFIDYYANGVKLSELIFKYPHKSGVGGLWRMCKKELKHYQRVWGKYWSKLEKYDM